MDIRIILFVFSFIYFIFALPVKEEPKKQSEDHENKEEEKIDKEIDDLGLEYGRYLQQVVEALEQDKEFAKKLENVSQEEIKNGVIAKELDFVHHSVRNKLDELKRIELDRLRQLARKEKQLQDGMPSDSDGRRWRTLGADSSAVSLDAEHLDHANPHSFEAEDLQKLILSATKDLEALDAKRKEDFKTYEMEKELRYREALLNMTEEERQKTIAKHDQLQEQHKQHPKVHHPGSKKQLEQVWEEQDHMPREEFNPKVFFTLHDVNGDGFLDPQEVEAILSVEIKKMYSDKNPEDDPNEMQEEYHRMREHIYKEADVNRDGLISKKEFLDFTHRMEFERDEGWKGLDEEQVYSEEDLKKFQQQRQQYEQRQQYAAYQQFQPQYYPEGYHPQQYDGQNYGQQPHHYIPPPHQLTPEQWAQQQQYYGYQQVPHPNQQMHPNQQQYLQQPNPQLHPQQQQQLLLQQQQALHQQQQQQALHQQQQQAVPQIQQHVPQQQMGGQPQQHLGGVPQQQHLNAVPQQQQQMGGVPQQQQQPAHLSGAPVPQSGQQSPPLPRH